MTDRLLTAAFLLAVILGAVVVALINVAYLVAVGIWLAVSAALAGLMGACWLVRRRVWARRAWRAMAKVQPRSPAWSEIIYDD